MTYFEKNRKIFSEVIKLALPAVGEMSLYMIVWTVDMMLVGRYGGENAISAVGMSAQFMYTFVDILVTIGIAVALTSIISRLRGARQHERLEEVAAHGMIVIFAVALISSAVFFMFSHKILSIYDLTQEVFDLGQPYFKIASFAVFFNMILAGLNGIYRGVGNTKVPFVSALVLTCVNLVLDVVLIFGINGFLELGVRGAAIATLLANIVAVVIAVKMFKKTTGISLHKKYIESISFGKLKELLSLGLLSGMQEGAFSICRLINSVMISSLGIVAYTANSITVQIESISFMPGWGVAVAATSLIGFKVGEKDYEGARRYGRVCLTLGCIFMGLCGVAFLIFPEFIASVFLQSDQVQTLQAAKLCIMIAAIEQIPTAISMIAGGALKGMGDTKSPFVISLFSNWVIRMPLMIIAIMILKLDISYVWWITSIQWTVDSVLMFISYRRKLSRKKAVL